MAEEDLMGARVLVVDDSPTIRKLVGAILSRHTYEAVLAADGHTALTKLREEPIDLVLLDFVMPRMNGYQFCLELRADERLKRTPVVLMSAKGDKIRGQFVQHLGAVDAITKPFDVRGLLAVVESALQKAAQGRLPQNGKADGACDDITVQAGPSPALVAAQQTSKRSRNSPQGEALTELSQRLADALAPLFVRRSVTNPAVANEAPVASTEARPQQASAVQSSDREQAPEGLSEEVPSSDAPAEAAATEAVAATATVPAATVPATAVPATAPADASANPLTRRKLADAIRRRLTPTVLESIAPSIRRLGIAHEPFAGETDVVPLAEVLQVLQLQRQTGTCRILSDRMEVTVCFREGLIDLALGRGAAYDFRIGRYFVEEGLVSRDELDRALEHGGGSGRRVGELLIQYGLIAQADLRRALIRQTSELLYEVLRWPKARFSFTKEVIEQPEVARLGLPVASIVMEGFRRVDEWRLIEESIQFDQVLLRDQVAVDALGDAKLTRQEQLVLDAVDGQRTVREILSHVSVSAFDACKILYQFLESRLVRQRAA